MHHFMLSYGFLFSFKILNGGTPDISSAGLLSGQIQDSSGYPYSDNSSILGKWGVFVYAFNIS